MADNFTKLVMKSEILKAFRQKPQRDVEGLRITPENKRIMSV